MGTTPSSLSGNTATPLPPAPTNTDASSGAVHAYCCRLKPGDDLVPSLLNAASTALALYPAAGSAFIMTAVGSLQDVKLRMASASSTTTMTKNDDKDISSSNSCNPNQQHIRHWQNERFEIVSLVGTFTSDGKSKHLHMSISDAKGNTFGGHLMSGTVFTTLELVIGTISGIQFSREVDSKTGYTELVVKPTNADTNNNNYTPLLPRRMVSPSPSTGRIRSTMRSHTANARSMPTSLLSPSLQNMSTQFLQRMQSIAQQTSIPDPIKISAKRCKQEIQRLKTKWTPHKAGAGRHAKFKRTIKKKM